MAQNEQSGGSGAHPIVIMLGVWYTLLLVLAIALTGFSENASGWAIVLVLGAIAPLGMLAAYRSTALAGSQTLERKVDKLTEAVNTMTREQGLSEGAKRVLHRREERELLRRAIEQDIQAEDWDAAMVLVKELAERFGYRADAEEFRARIERARAETLDRKVVDALAHLDDLIRSLQWTDAYAEAARIQRLYPESHRVDDLRERVDDSRRRYRKDLERRFLMSAQRQRIDDAMELLKELDQYLSPAEAEQYQEVARGVISKSRENLGVRFKLMLQDHQWADAVAVGEQIIAEFPNTRMAQEVRDILPTLRERSSGTGTGSIIDQAGV
ncbi:MAG: hypothetical protein AAFX05_08195 [Planctomycetota bacterium]